MKCKIKKFRRQKPYNADGKTNFRYTNGKSGVYLIYKKDKLVYVGFSASNVYKTLYRHFQSWNDPTQIRITYKNAKKSNTAIRVRVVLTSPDRARRLEKMIIKKHKPKDNPMKYADHKPTKTDIKLIEDFIGTKAAHFKKCISKLCLRPCKLRGFFIFSVFLYENFRFQQSPGFLDRYLFGQ